MPDALTRNKFAPPVDADAVAEDWRRRGYSCHAFFDPPGRAWTDFVHATNELVTVVAGRLEVEVDGAPLLLEPGDEAFIPRDAIHTVRNIAEVETNWLFGYD